MIYIYSSVVPGIWLVLLNRNNLRPSLNFLLLFIICWALHELVFLLDAGHAGTLLGLATKAIKRAI